MSREMLRRLARRELGPREIAEVLRHVGECEECASAQGAELQVPLDVDEGPWHPDHAEVAAYVDGSAGPAEREIVESHLEDCALCREDVRDLEKLRRPHPTGRIWYAALAAAAALAVMMTVLMQRDEETPRPERHTARSRVVLKRPAAGTIGVAAPVPRATAKPKYANKEWEKLVRKAVESRRLPFPRGIDASPDVLRGPDGQPAGELVPSGVTVGEVRPRFSWPAREGATYVVSVFRDDRRVAQSEPLKETRWTPATPLARGRTYSWQVEATHGDAREIIPAPPVPQARFRIVSTHDRDELAKARRLYPDDSLLHAVLAARAGLREEALEALSRVSTNIRPW